VLPGGSLSAASLNLLASSASRSSKVSVCLIRGRNLTMTNPVSKLPIAFCNPPMAIASVRRLTQKVKICLICKSRGKDG
jgi:hypothetical protein